MKQEDIEREKKCYKFTFWLFNIKEIITSS